MYEVCTVPSRVRGAAPERVPQHGRERGGERERQGREQAAGPEPEQPRAALRAAGLQDAREPAGAPPDGGQAAGRKFGSL